MTLGTEGIATMILAFLGFLWNVGRKVKHVAAVLLVFACAREPIGPEPTTTPDEQAPPPIQLELPSDDARAMARVAARRLRQGLAPTSSTRSAAAAATDGPGALLDWSWLRAQKAVAWKAFLDDVTGPTFAAPELKGCVRGYKVTFGGSTAYGIAGRLLDWARTLPTGQDRERALAWVREHVLHVMRFETFRDANGFSQVAGEGGVAEHVSPQLSDPKARDTDYLRHLCLEPYAQAVLDEAVPFTEEERDEATRWLLGAGKMLQALTQGPSMAVTNTFYEGAHARLFFTLDNLTWCYLATGERGFVEHAERLAVQCLGWTIRGPDTMLPAPFPLWAGSDPVECGGRALGNPNAPHRGAAWWHLADSGRRLASLAFVTDRPDVRSLLVRWVLVQTELALRPGNPICRGGSVRLSGGALRPTENDPVPWALLNPKDALTISPTTPYQFLTGVQNWVWDGDYHSKLLPDGRTPRMRYNDGTTDRLGVLIDFPNGFGAADLWWCRFLITGKEEDRLRALVALRDRLFWGNAPGPLVLVTTGNRSGFPYNGGNVGRARTFAWAMECGGLLPWDGSAEASSFTALR